MGGSDFTQLDICTFYRLKNTWLQPKFEVSSSRNKFFGIMAPAFYLKYAVFQRKISSWVKSDPPPFKPPCKKLLKFRISLTQVHQKPNESNICQPGPKVAMTFSSINLLADFKRQQRPKIFGQNSETPITVAQDFIGKREGAN